MSEITIKSKVECSDGPGGKTTHLIADPQSSKLTHIVVKDKHLPNSPDRLVPIELVGNASGGVVNLNCTREELENMPSYTTIHYVQKGIPNYPLGMTGAQVSDTSPLPGDSWVEKAEKVHLPDGELDVSQDMVVKSEGNKVGKVDGLVVDSESGAITHLLMRKGHLWGAKDVSIPLSAIDLVVGDEIHLNIDKDAIKDLPSLSLKSHSI